MKLTKDALNLDLPTTATRIKRFIKDYLKKTKTKGIVIGISGGIDSSTVSALAALAIGGHKVTALNMPEEETHSKTDIQHAKKVAEKFRFKIETIDITSILEAYYKSIPIYDPQDKLSKGNLKARTRMLCLYYYANHQGKIVCGSSDKSETMMGYFTKWGDVAADISPLMDFYKTQVRQLAEEELGIQYETLDLILLGLENFMSPEEIADQLKLPSKLVRDIRSRWLAREHKRRPPLTLKQEYRTIGTDFRLPYTPAH